MLKPKNKRISIYLVLLGVLFAILYPYVFDKKVSPNGDNAEYYILGKSIATGNGYTNIHRYEANSAKRLPPGYPAIIAGTIKVFGENFLLQKKVNGAFFIFSILVLFFLFYRIEQNKNLAFIICLFTLINTNLLMYSSMVMSEISFLLFSSLCLLSLIKINNEVSLVKDKWFWFYLIFSLCAFYIKTSGVALLVTGLAYFSFRKKWRHILASIIVFTVAILPWQLRTSKLGGSPYINQLLKVNPYQPELGTMHVQDWFIRFWENLNRYISREIPGGCFNFYTIKYNESPNITEYIFGVIITILIGYGLYKVKRYRVILALYLICNFGILLLWPPVWTGIRFVLPLAPILLFFIGIALTSIVKKISNKLRIGDAKFAPFILLLGLPFFKAPLEHLHLISKEGTYKEGITNYLKIAAWAKNNIDNNSIVCCRKDKLFYLYSNKKTARYLYSLNPEEVLKDLEDKKVSHVVFDQLGYTSTNKYLLPVLKRYPFKFKEEKHIAPPSTILLKFQPELGYKGEWKNNKRHGYGFFRWPNNTCYEGEWKENYRHGKGVFTLQNKDKIEGYWINDTLNGPVLIHLNNSDKIQRALYHKNKLTKLLN